MAEYTKRTCYKCGKRDIQPNMSQIEIEYESGTSKSGITEATIIGALLGHKASGRAIGRTLFNSSKRKYYRKKKVWACQSCHGKANGEVLNTILGIIFVIICIFALIY